MTNRPMRGFTLIELMITVVVIAIIAAIALPSYQNSIRKSRRADARSALMSAAQAMEKYYTENQKYTSATLGSGASDVHPATSSGGYYALDFSSTPNASSFTLRATPQGGQSSDACGKFTLTSAGVKGVTDGSLTAADCW